jgi:hypothetical protein
MRRRRSHRHAAAGGRRRAGALVLALAWGALGVAGAFAEDPPGTPTSRAALEACHRADGEAEPDELLSTSLALADQAVAADDGDALAYFARFCALGKQARRSGASLSSLFKVWALRDAVDQTLERAPQFPDALLGKGALLSSLPRILGGDPEAGEKLIGRALEIDPDYVEARLFRARSLAESGQPAVARAEAQRALASAERKNDRESAAAARQLLAGIGD